MSNSASLDKYHDLLMAAWLYANTRSPQDRAVMLSLGNSFWDGFPSFLLEMKDAIKSGRSGEFLKQDDVKHMYALLFMSILNGLDSDHLNKVGRSLLSAASPGKARSSKGTRVEERRVP